VYNTTSKCHSLFGIDSLAADAKLDCKDECSDDESKNLSFDSSDEFSSESEVYDSDCNLLQDTHIWCATDVQHPSAAPPCFPFAGRPGIRISLTDKQNPLICVRLFLDENIVNNIVMDTNRYAEKTLTRMPHRCRSCTQNWESIAIDDLWLFFSTLSYCKKSYTSHNNGDTGPPIDCWRCRFSEKS